MACHSSERFSPLDLKTRGQGKYTSTVHSNTGDQGKDQGLTLSPKIPSTDPWHSLHGPTLLDQELDALLGPVQFRSDGNEIQGNDDLVKDNPKIGCQTSSEPPNKRRKFSPEAVEKLSLRSNALLSPESAFHPTVVSKPCPPVTVPVSQSLGNSGYLIDNSAPGISAGETYQQVNENCGKDPLNISRTIGASNCIPAHSSKISSRSLDGGSNKYDSIQELSRESQVQLPYTPTVVQSQQTGFPQLEPDVPSWNPVVPNLSNEKVLQSQVQMQPFTTTEPEWAPDLSLNPNETDSHNKTRHHSFKDGKFSEESSKPCSCGKNSDTHDSSTCQSPARSFNLHSHSVSTGSRDKLLRPASVDAYQNQLYRKIITSLPMACSLEMAGSSQSDILALIVELTTYGDYRETAPDYQIPGPYRQILDELNAQWGQGTKRNEFRKALIAYVKEKIETEMSQAIPPGENNPDQSQSSNLLTKDEAAQAITKWIDEVGIMGDSSKNFLRHLLAEGRERVAYLKDQNSQLQLENARLLKDLENLSAQLHNNKKSDNTNALSNYLSQFGSSFPQQPPAGGLFLEQDIASNPVIGNWDDFGCDLWNIGEETHLQGEVESQ